MGSCSLLQEIFPTQGLNPGFLHCRWILYHLRHQWSPRILEWVAYPFSRGSSWPRNRTKVSCITGRFFTNWDTGKTQWRLLLSHLSHVLLCVTPWTIQSRILQGRIPRWIAFPYPGNLSNPGIKNRSPALQVDYLPAEPQGKPKNTGIGSLSLLQQIFPTQELNQGLLLCSWILYQLSYQGSPLSNMVHIFFK